MAKIDVPDVRLGPLLRAAIRVVIVIALAYAIVTAARVMGSLIGPLPYTPSWPVALEGWLFMGLLFWWLKDEGYALLTTAFGKIEGK